MNVAIAGLGTIGLRHLATLESLGGVSVVAAADPRFAEGDELAVPTFRSYEDMLDAVPLEAVVLCTPSWLHAEQGVLAAERGLHVISEKPLAVTLDGANQLVDACARHRVSLAVLHQYRFHAPLVRLKQAIVDGELGKLVFVNIAFFWRRDRAYYEKGGGWRGTWRGDGGGALMNQGAHAVDLARWLGGPIESVMTHRANVEHEIEAEDTVGVSLRFIEGALGSIQVTTCAATNHPPLIEVQGTIASATVSGRLFAMNGGDPVTLEPGREPHLTQFAEIFRSLAEGEPPPVRGDDARQTLSDTLAMYESARLGVAVACSPAIRTATVA